MKKEKGEAAFDSVDEVLTGKIIDTTEKHGKEKETSSPDSASDCSYDTEYQEQENTGPHHGKAIIIAACAGIVLLLIGIFLFSCRKCCRGK